MINFDETDLEKYSKIYIDELEINSSYKFQEVGNKGLICFSSPKEKILINPSNIRYVRMIKK